MTRMIPETPDWSMLILLLFLTRTQMLVQGLILQHTGVKAISVIGSFLLEIQDISARPCRCRQDPQTCLGLDALQRKWLETGGDYTIALI
jgi:hypothetical protein